MQSICDLFSLFAEKEIIFKEKSAEISNLLLAFAGFACYNHHCTYMWRIIMNILYGIILGLLVLASILMCVVVLLQKSKSAGIGAAYGSETKTFSSRGKAASREAKLQKITVYLAIVIAVLAIVLPIIQLFK